MKSVAAPRWPWRLHRPWHPSIGGVTETSALQRPQTHAGLDLMALTRRPWCLQRPWHHGSGSVTEASVLQRRQRGLRLTQASASQKQQRRRHGGHCITQATASCKPRCHSSVMQALASWHHRGSVMEASARHPSCKGSRDNMALCERLGKVMSCPRP